MADEQAVLERGSKGEEDAARRDEAKAPPPPPPPPSGAPPAAPQGSPDLLALGNFLAAQGQLRKKAQERAEAFAPKVEAVQQQGADLAKQATETVPKPPALAAPPSRQLSGFLAARPGESAEASVNKFLSAIGLFAAGSVGLSKGNARGSLAALTGAMAGWQQGDAEWAQRRYEDWKAETDTMLAQHKTQREQWEQWFKASTLAQDQRTKGLELEILRAGFDLEPYKIEVQGAEGLLKFMEERRKAEQQLELARDKIVEQRERHLSDQALRKQLADEARETRLAIAAQSAADRIAARDEAERNRREARDERRQDKLNEPYKHEVWDKSKGDIVTVTRGEREEDLQRSLRNEPTRFKDMSPQEKQAVDRLALAPSLLKRLDVLIDRILAENPGENLTQGLINRMRKNMAPDIAEFQNLSADAAVELAAALSGGQPRISILAMIRGDAQPGLNMTRETAKAQTSTAYITIANRLTRLTGDPDAIKHVSKDFQDYGQREQSIIIVGPNGERRGAPANIDLSKYPQWKKE